MRARLAVWLEIALVAATTSACAGSARNPSTYNMRLPESEPNPLAPGERWEDAGRCTELCGHYAEFCERREGGHNQYVTCGKIIEPKTGQPAYASPTVVTARFEGQACLDVCGETQCLLHREGARLWVECRERPCGPAGRLSLGLHQRDVCAHAATTLGGLFARMAQLESAAVVAFEQLAVELEHHAAPRQLVARAQRSAREEGRHQRIMRGLARREGVDPAPVSLSLGAPRSLEDILAENAAEGCVGELVATALLVHQSRHAEDASVRAALAAIADDELGHAALAFDIDAWGRTQLSDDAWARVEAARQRAAAQMLSAQLPSLPGAGLPTEPARRAMVSALLTASMAA